MGRRTNRITNEYSKCKRNYDLGSIVPIYMMSIIIFRLQLCFGKALYLWVAKYQANQFAPKVMLGWSPA